MPTQWEKLNVPSSIIASIGYPWAIEIGGRCGNGGTVVQLRVTQVPKDWVATVTSQVTLAEGTGSSATAYLTVIPPKSFGYHNEEQTIEVSLQPMFADDMSQKGVISYESFLVQSRGFSAPGFETSIFLGAFAMTLLIVVYIRRRKK